MPDPSARSKATKGSSRSEKGSREERATEGDIDPETKSHPKEPPREEENERKRNMTKKSTGGISVKEEEGAPDGSIESQTVGNQRSAREVRRGKERQRRDQNEKTDEETG